MRIGFIGAGNIGGTLARLAAAAGHDVVLSNSRGPDTLAEAVSEIGARASAATAMQAAAAGELVVVTIPLKSYRDVPVAELAGKVVIDTNNYYPGRDGQFPELDSDASTSSELLAAHLPDSHVVKAFNTIHFADLAGQGEPTGTPGRRALPIAGDDEAAKGVVAAFIDSLGFDVVDAGPLREGHRFQPGTPAYNVRLGSAELAQALAATGG